MNFKFNYFNKEIIIGDVEMCKTFFQKLRGLMFRRDLKILVFPFNIYPILLGNLSIIIYDKSISVVALPAGTIG